MTHTFWLNRKEMVIMKKYALYCIAMLLCMMCPRVAYSVPANPEAFQHKQNNGEVITYHLHGDEFLHWINDQYGRLIVMRNGDFYFAEWRNEEEVKKGDLSLQPIKVDGSWVRATNLDAEGKEISLSKEIIDQRLINLVPDYVRKAAQEKIHRHKLDNSRQEVVRKNSSSLKTSVPGSLERNILIIYTIYDTPTNLTPLGDAELYDLVFNRNKHGSVAHYYSAVTGGSAKLTPAHESYGTSDDGVVVVRLSGAHPNWAGTPEWDDLRSVIMAANSYVDFSQYDKNGDGQITTNELSICIIVHGYETSSIGANSENYPSIWGHAWSIAPTLLDGVYVSCYFAQGAYHGMYAPYPLTMGILAHEFGHSAYDFDDVYDYGTVVNDGKAGAFGYWSLMASGSWGRKVGEKSGTTPAAIDPYNLTKYDILDYKEILSNNANGGYSMFNTMDIYRVNTNNSKQYFLLQYRSGNTCGGYDLGILEEMGGNADSGGVLICHVDESVTDSAINDRNDHPKIDIEEAHGGVQNLQQVQLRANFNNGDLNDLFANNRDGDSKTEFSQFTDPNSNQYYAFPGASQTVASGVMIHSMSSNNTKASFSLGTGSTKFVSEIILSVPNDDKNILAGDWKQIEYEIIPDDADNISLAWKSSNTEVATVDQNGFVDANFVNDKNVTITARANDGGGAVGNITLTVVNPVQGIRFEPVDIKVNEIEADAEFCDKYLKTVPENAPLLIRNLSLKSENNNLVFVAKEGEVIEVSASEEIDYADKVALTARYGILNATCYVYTKGGPNEPTKLNLTAKLQERLNAADESIKTVIFDTLANKKWEGTATANSSGVVSYTVPAGVIRSGETLKLLVKPARFVPVTITQTVNVDKNICNIFINDEFKGGDADDDGYVGPSDFSILNATYLKQEGDAEYNAGADFDTNGRIRLNDFYILWKNYGACPPPPDQDDPGTSDPDDPARLMKDGVIVPGLCDDVTALYIRANREGALSRLIAERIGNKTPENGGGAGLGGSSGGCSSAAYGGAALLLCLCLLPLRRKKGK